MIHLFESPEMIR
jgi:hypothetical protein